MGGRAVSAAHHLRPSHVRRSARPLALALVAGAACHVGNRDGEGGDDGCPEGACQVAGTREELLAALDGLSDPMAEWLRGASDDAGGVSGGYAAVLDGLGAQIGCARSSERAFVVLSNQALHPKAIVTRCVDDPVTASNFFMVLEPSADGMDLDPERVRVAAWDAAAGRFHRYQLQPRSDIGGLGVAVEPAFCGGCHGGPFELEPWTPIMNEMSNPWAQWNAEPGFSSFQFDEAFPAGTTGPVFEEVTAGARLASASNLEPIIRAAIDRTSNARLSERTDAPDLEVALGLLRPVFCDESVNFVSEIHDSGELATHAVVDAGLRRAMLALAEGESWPWPWVTDPTVRIPAPGAGDPPLAMIAIRGETTAQVEAALLSRNVLDAEQILRVRALDWTHPVFSELRCGQWEAAADRARGGAVDPAEHADNASLVDALYREAMLLTIDGASVPLLADAPGAVVAIADATDPEAIAALSTGELSAYERTPEELGAEIDAFVTSFESGDARVRLDAERHRRGCLARQAFVITPLLPGIDECA